MHLELEEETTLDLQEPVMFPDLCRERKVMLRRTMDGLTWAAGRAMSAKCTKLMECGGSCKEGGVYGGTTPTRI